MCMSRSIAWVRQLRWDCIWWTKSPCKWLRGYCIALQKYRLFARCLTERCRYFDDWIVQLQKTPGILSPWIWSRECMSRRKILVSFLSFCLRTGSCARSSGFNLRPVLSSLRCLGQNWIGKNYEKTSNLQVLKALSDKLLHLLVAWQLNRFITIFCWSDLCSIAWVCKVNPWSFRDHHFFGRRDVAWNLVIDGLDNHL